MFWGFRVSGLGLRVGSKTLRAHTACRGTRAEAQTGRLRVEETCFDFDSPLVDTRLPALGVWGVRRGAYGQLSPCQRSERSAQMRNKRGPTEIMG